MKILGSNTVVRSTDRDAAVVRFAKLFGEPPLDEFPIEGRGLTVSVFRGVSVLCGPAEALAELAHLRATVFVSSLADAEAELQKAGWVTSGGLGGASLSADDPDGNLLEFVENPTASQ